MIPPPHQACCTIGDLEEKAGIEDRAAFWLPFARYPDGFQRGVVALTGIVEARR